ncbi:MAG: AMIN domain-containing protein [Terriglobales bacterium]
MQRVSHAGFLLAFAALLPAMVSAQNRPPNVAPNSAPNVAPKAATKNARVQHVVVRGGDVMEVEIQTSGTPVAPQTQAIAGPDRIVVDFPGALPAAELKALTVNRGALKGVRSGLFSNNPPITRVVLDLTEPQSYQISTVQNAIVVKLSPSKLNPVGQASGNLNPGKSGPALTTDSAKVGSVKTGSLKPGSSKSTSAGTAAVKTPVVRVTHAGKLQPVSLVASTNAASTNPPGTPSTNGAAAASAQAAVPPPLAVSATLQPMPLVDVSFANGMLRIHAENATLSQVLFEVQRQTQAEIAIPAGAEREQVIADLGPGTAREVLSALLNGSPYNFIFVGNEREIQQVILTVRQPNIF